MILRLNPSDNFWYIYLMRLLFVADGRSPIALNWIRYFSDRGDDVYLASTFACAPGFHLSGLDIVPVAYSGRVRATATPTRQASGRLLGLRTVFRHWLGPMTIRRSSGRLRTLIEQVKPDLVHAMRIPFEGMLAADAYSGRPLLVSVWGNDFTLHASTTRLMAHYTSWTMEVADGLHADCQRDIRLGRQWGFDPSRPTLVTPGNGGIRMDVFHAPAQPVDAPVIVNPRGFRAYVRNDAFFRAIPLVLAKRPDAHFRCVAMAGESRALQWINELGIRDAVELLPPVAHEQMADLFRSAQVVASISTHDGTPNTLLEGMACGCLPVAGDLESIREWIRPGKNGLLADANDPQSVAAAILEALQNKGLRQAAAAENQNIILERAEYGRCMTAAGRFYQRVIESGMRAA